MKNKIKIWMAVETIILCICILIIFRITLTDNQTTKQSDISLVTQYVDLEKLKNELNMYSIVGDFTLDSNWNSYGMAAKPLYVIDREYSYSTKSEDGEIVAVSKYIQAEYLSGQNKSMFVRLIQDKTFENGGFIYFDHEQSKNIVTQYYRYKNCYLIFDSESEIHLEEMNIFIDKLFQIISENYQEKVEG